MLYFADGIVFSSFIDVQNIIWGKNQYFIFRTVLTLPHTGVALDFIDDGFGVDVEDMYISVFPCVYHDFIRIIDFDKIDVALGEELADFLHVGWILNIDFAVFAPEVEPVFDVTHVQTEYGSKGLDLFAVELVLQLQLGVLVFRGVLLFR